MSAVFPQGMERDSEFLYDRMREATYAALRVSAGGRVMDSAAGLGTDSQNLAERGVCTTNVEPSASMNSLIPIIARDEGWKDYGDLVKRVRAWSEVLPFERGAFDAVFCKGSIDHFDDAEGALAEMARVTRPGGRVVVAVANFDSLGCRLLRLGDRLRGGPRIRGHYHVPPDHFTRYDLDLILSQMAKNGSVEEVVGISLFWGVRSWAALLERLPASVATGLLRIADSIARLWPSLADIVVIAVRPK